tara:strand:+ start:296 stop:469 length:174 start_codon:yes stop_codon:yes gene_type:complete
MKLSYKKQLKKMEEDSRKVKEMQEQIYGTKKPKINREIAGYYWDGKEEHILYDKEPL